MENKELLKQCYHITEILLKVALNTITITLNQWFISQSQVILKKLDGDNNSDLSAEVTTSDSGRGGSEDDLNTSTVISYSVDFGKITKNYH